MRLVILNSCEGSRGDNVDVFSSTAAVLVRRGTPGVVAMQYPITDRAAIEFSRSFYGAIVAGTPIDTAISVARQSISLEIPGTLEWGTPTLYLRAPDGVLFELPPLDEPPRGLVEPTVTAALPSPVPPAGQPQQVAPVQAISGSVPIGESQIASRAALPVSTQDAVLRAEGRPTGASTRALIERGWRTGHLQTLVGAELGAIAAMTLNFQSTLSLAGDPTHEIAYVATWLFAVAGALLLLRLTGPRGWWKTVIVLVFLFPLFRGLASGSAIYAMDYLPDFLKSVLVVAILALVASSIPLLKRPQAS
jgi:hypothetical protein